VVSADCPSIRVGVPTVHFDPCRLTNGPRPGGTSQKPHSGHTGTISIAVLVRNPPERHETPDPVRPDAVKARFQCVRQALGLRLALTVASSPGQLAPAPLGSRLLRLAHVRPCVRSRVRACVHSCARSSVRARPGRTRVSDQARQLDSKEAWARSGAWPPRAQTGKARYLSALQ
jgi:hypothetical protein